MLSDKTIYTPDINYIEAGLALTGLIMVCYTIKYPEVIDDINELIDKIFKR